MTHVLVVVLAVLGCLGVLARAVFSLILGPRFEQWLASFAPPLMLGWPAATLAVNLLGTFCAGLVWSRVPESARILGASTRIVLSTGFLGGFTTFSSFALEIARYIEDGDAARGLSYALASVVLGVGCAWAGMHV